MEGDHLWTSWGGTWEDSGGVVIVVAKDRAGLIAALRQAQHYSYIAYECLDLACEATLDPDGGDPDYPFYVMDPIDLPYEELAEFFRKCSRDEGVTIDWKHVTCPPLTFDPPSTWKEFPSNCALTASLRFTHGAGDWAHHLPTGTVITRGP